MNIKGGMIKDLMNICGFVIPDKNDVTPLGPAVVDSRLVYTQSLSVNCSGCLQYTLFRETGVLLSLLIQCIGIM